MRIFFYPECNFNINKASVYDCGSLAEWFDSQHKNPDDYEIVGKDGEYHDSDYNGEVCAVYPKIMGGKKKGKNILTAVVGLALVLATGGTTAALFANYGGLNMAHALGAGLLLSGGGALLMGKMKMPSMDLSSDSATKENYQWNVGNLSTSRGVKGVTFGSNVIPEGELLAYRTYGTNSIEKIVRSTKEAGYYYGGDYNKSHLKKVGTYNAKYYKWLPGYTEYASVSTDSSSYLEMLIGCGEGELDSITDIKINDIPVSDLEMVQDVDYAIRLGSNTQTALKQTNLDSQAGYLSIGQTVPVKLNGSVTPLLITTPSACDSCCIAFQVPNWYMYDTSSGAKNSAFIKLKIGYRTSGSSGSYTYLTKTGITEIDNTTALKSDSAFYFQVAIKFPSNGTYQISIENDSAELNNTKGLLSASEYLGSALPDRAAINMSVDNIACYNNKEQTYPNTALIWLRIPASQTLNGSMPKVTWKQTRASIYAYNGSSYVAKPADNLAWAIYDIIAQVRKDGNTYHNEGEDVANIDFDKFVAFASFCDSIGAKGNWFLNKLDTSWSNAMSVATSCRAFIGLRSGKVCPYWDAPTEMTQIFTVGNYEDMSGVITAKKDRAKAIEATFNNEEEKFASRTVRVEIDNDHSAEAVSMTFAGLSDPVNVSKQAHYILRRNKYLVQSVKFTADIDSIVCELNDVIGIQCDLTEYGVGGRIFKVENNVISLDAPVTLESGKTYALLVRHTDGTLERNTPVETNGTYTQLTFNSSWSKPVLKGDVYSFGIANSEVRKYRVTGITRANDLKAQIEAIEYNENVYDELAVAPYTYTNPNAGINNVTTTYTPESVELAWDANNNTSYVNVYVDGVFYGRYQNGAEIPNINSEQLVEMFPVNEYGEEDTPVVRTISNNLPTPSTPPVPIVQSTTTGCVAEFDGIPKNENIVWLIIKEGDNELGRANILGEYMSVSIQLTSGTHTLSAYFVNQFSKSSQARTFTATPLGDLEASSIAASALKMPTGSILRLSAKYCTTASIALDSGVKDCSGRSNNGKAYGGAQVVTDNELGDCFSFDGSNDYLLINNSNLLSVINTLSVITLYCKIKPSTDSGNRHAFDLAFPNNVACGIYINNKKISLVARRITSDSSKTVSADFNIEINKTYDVAGVFDFSIGKMMLFIDGVLIAEDNSLTTGTITGVANVYVGCVRNDYYFGGIISDVRIYPRGLSATEVKSVSMMPDEAVFAQLTTDMFGANIIRANYILNDGAFASLAVQAVNADINNLNVVGNATFQSTLTNSINNIAIGGRNLILAPTATKSFTTASTTGSQDCRLSSLATTIKSTDDLTISFEAKASEERWLDFYWNDGNNSYAGGGYFYGVAHLTTDYQKFTFTDKSSKNITSDYVLRFRQKASESGGASGGPTISLKNIKLEIGNKATSYTPAQEDVDSDIASGDSSTLSSAKTYADGKASTAQSNAEAAAAAALAAVTNNIYYTGTTKINGGVIQTESIGAAAIAANAINANKISVLSTLPKRLLWLNFKGCNNTKNSEIPDLSAGHGYYNIASNNDYNSIFCSYGIYVLQSSSSSKNNKRRIINKSETTLELGTSFSIGFAYIRVNTTGASAQPVVFEASNGTNNNKIQIYIDSSRNIVVDNYNSSGTKTSITLGKLGASVNSMLIISCDNGTWSSYIAPLGSASDSVTPITSSTTSTRSALTATQISFGNTYAGDSSRGPSGYWVSGANIFDGAISQDTAEYCFKFSALNSDESGQITADRIATDAIKSRNYDGTTVDNHFATNGSFLNLADGTMKTKYFALESSGGYFKGTVNASGGKIGPLNIDSNYGFSNQTTGTYGKNGINLYYNSIESYQSGRDISNNFTLGYGKISSSDLGKKFGFGDYFDPTSANPLCLIGEYYNNQVSPRTDYTFPILKIEPYQTTHYGLYIKGKARIQSGEVTSDESVKKDFQEVSTLDKLKKLRVCAWRFDEEKLVEKENDWIDKENIKIEAENKAIDAENAEIEKENENRKNRKDGEPVELLPLKEHKKLRERRTADKNTNHPLNIGCMAGEFNKAFGTNDGSEEALNITDTIGVCMRAIQELAEISDAQRIEIDSQKAEINELKALLKIQQDEKSDVEQENKQEEQK